ncbi:DNA topoisomerase IV [Myroides indicus]|uniref:DNA topoisomerase IV n=1 Tax=Myroides indicus TaxID=1323422 RepID=A0A4R7EYN4_9FLAO|nr:DNA topoisomerase IV [Myroides indicus]TDS57563.1 hypothetical protein C8P70_11562 [Myroides indicus]
MKLKLLSFLPLFIFFGACYNQEKNCDNFRTGTFEFITEINGETKVSTFVRNENIEIETFEGKTDTASIRWVNNCEFILQKLNPKNMAEQKAINMRIISTDGDTCLFEYGLVGDDRKQRGTLRKIAD